MMTSSASVINMEMNVIKQCIVPNVENIALLDKGLSLKH